MPPFVKGDVRRTEGFLFEKDINKIIFIVIYIFRKNMIISYNSNNKDYARINRNQYTMTEAEWKICNLVLRKDKTWYRFLRQKPIWNYIIDFYCHKLKLWIEIDDDSHNVKWIYDIDRTKYFNTLWIEIIRYTNNDVYYKLDSVAMDLETEIKERENKL